VAQFKKFPPDNINDILIRKEQYERECDKDYKNNFNDLFVQGLKYKVFHLKYKT
jgi:hypothetical protein